MIYSFKSELMQKFLIGKQSFMSVNHTEIHKPKKCAKCGSKDITDTKILTKMLIDIINIPKTEYTNNIIHHCTCKCKYTAGRNISR